MAKSSGAPIDALLAAAADGPENPSAVSSLLARGGEAFDALAASLRAELPIARLERFERILKDLLAARMSSPLSGDETRQLARFQRSVGFLLKYKPYAIKAASPLGYSVFLQRPGEGFSFQRHIVHKTEIFYVLDVQPGGYVFICEHDDWARLYQRPAFEAWLNGQGGPYEAFRYAPQPGDVIVIDRLNVVHTVVGCTLAEFATVSTDMVDRLHDQNEGRSIPAEFTRGYAESRLRAIRWPHTSRYVHIAASGVTQSPIVPEQIAGGTRTTFGQGAVMAAASCFAPGTAGEIAMDPKRAVALHVVEGVGTLVLGDAEEVRRQPPPAIDVSAGDLLLVPPGAYFGLVSDRAHALTVAEHRIEAATAFVRG